MGASGKGPRPMALWMESIHANGHTQNTRAVIIAMPVPRSRKMSNLSRRDRLREAISNGLLMAGVPPAKMPGGYFPAFKENQLTGEEIKRLLFGSAITGYVYYPQQFWMEYKKNGEFTWRGSDPKEPNSSDTGKSRIDGDAICWQYQKRFGGIEYCGTVFRYPGGTYDGKDEYFWGTDLGYGTFSLVK